MYVYVLWSSSMSLLTTFRICTVFTLDIVTHLETGYGSTHIALVTRSIMSDLSDLTALMQQLVAIVVSQT